MKKKSLGALVVLLAVALLLLARFQERPKSESPWLGAPQIEPPKPKTELYRVLKVHDGDTVSVSIGGRREKIRLIGIDAPELGQKPWGMRAKRHLQEMLGNQDVGLQLDAQERDRYGRLLAYLRTEDGQMINRMMIRDGYAVLLTIPPNVRYAGELKETQEEARKSSAGIWGKGGLRETPSRYRGKHRR